MWQPEGQHQNRWGAGWQQAVWTRHIYWLMRIIFVAAQQRTPHNLCHATFKHASSILCLFDWSFLKIYILSGWRRYIQFFDKCRFWSFGSWGESARRDAQLRDIVSSVCWSRSKAVFLIAVAYHSDWWVQHTVFVQSYMDLRSKSAFCQAQKRISFCQWHCRNDMKWLYSMLVRNISISKCPIRIMKDISPRPSCGKIWNGWLHWWLVVGAPGTTRASGGQSGGAAGNEFN